MGADPVPGTTIGKCSLHDGPPRIALARRKAGAQSCASHTLRIVARRCTCAKERNQKKNCSRRSSLSPEKVVFSVCVVRVAARLESLSRTTTLRLRSDQRAKNSRAVQRFYYRGATSRLDSQAFPRSARDLGGASCSFELVLSFTVSFTKLAAGSREELKRSEVQPKQRLQIGALYFNHSQAAKWIFSQKSVQSTDFIKLFTSEKI